MQNSPDRCCSAGLVLISPNTKVIISDGDLPVLLGPSGDEGLPSNTRLRR